MNLSSAFWRALGGGFGEPLAVKLADVICKLTIDAGELGELEQYQYLGDKGELMTGHKFPTRWIARLDKAVETGSLARFSTDQICEILLAGPR